MLASHGFVCSARVKLNLGSPKLGFSYSLVFLLLAKVSAPYPTFNLPPFQADLPASAMDLHHGSFNSRRNNSILLMTLSKNGLMKIQTSWLCAGSTMISRKSALTYAHFGRRSHRAAVWLQRVGLRRGDRLLLLLPKIPEWWEIACAAIRSGIVLCPCSTLLTAKDLQYRVRASRATAFVGDNDAITKFLAVAGSCPDVRQIGSVSGGNWSHEIGAASTLGTVAGTLQQLTSYEAGMHDVSADGEVSRARFFSRRRLPHILHIWNDRHAKDGPALTSLLSPWPRSYGQDVASSPAVK